MQSTGAIGIAWVQSEACSEGGPGLLSSSCEHQSCTHDTICKCAIGIERQGFIAFRNASLKISRDVHRSCEAHASDCIAGIERKSFARQLFCGSRGLV